MNYTIPFFLALAACVILAVFLIVNMSSTDVAPESCETCEECEVCQEIPAEKAMIYGALNSWGENIYDSSEYIFTVDMFNFGYKEAKNVEVTCEINVGDEDGYQISEYPINTIVKKIGNVASTSYKYVELTTEKDYKKEGNYPLANCFVSSCDNCDILTERIPELE